MTNWTLSPYRIFQGTGVKVEIVFDHDKINACRKGDWQSDCQFCPARARCDELVREEWRRELGAEPPEEAE